MKEPSHTCPSIDKAQGRIKDAAEDLRRMALDFSGGYRDLCDLLEDLRGQNEELREWGTIWRDEAEELKAKVSELEARVDELEEQLSEVPA